MVSTIANWHPLISGPPYRASFYRERKVSKEEFYQALEDQLAIYNVSDQAIGDICYGSDRNASVTNLLLFLEGGRTWPVGDKYECPTRPPKSNYCWTQGGVDGGSGYFPGIQVGDLVTGIFLSWFASVFSNLFASVVRVPKNWCKRSLLLGFLMSRKPYFWH